MNPDNSAVFSAGADPDMFQVVYLNPDNSDVLCRGGSRLGSMGSMNPDNPACLVQERIQIGFKVFI